MIPGELYYVSEWNHFAIYIGQCLFHANVGHIYQRFVKKAGRSAPEKPERVKVRAPTLANLQSVRKMLETYNLADLPIIIAAIDPCFSCTDRTISVKNLDKGSTEIMDWKTLRVYSIEWYKKRGVDFKNVGKSKS